jgi:ParB family protein of integrating conjugative element (PFGI_1 class)
MNGKGSVAERRRLVAESLRVGNPVNHARELPGPVDPPFESQIELAVDEIQPYEHNPRRTTNAKFDDIKESIRTAGLRSPLTVTRRPGESHFIVEAGGNTRLLALRQLWAETRDPRFRALTVLYRPWRSESHVLTAHLIENEQRGEMTFWDKACGIVALKSRLEAEQGRTLTLRPLEDALHTVGLAVNTATLGLYLFATERLRTLGEAVTGLSGLDVKTMQPRLNALKRYAQAQSEMTEDDLYAQVFEPVFRRLAQQYPQTRTFSVGIACEACEVALAAYLDETVERLRAATTAKDVRGPTTSPEAVVPPSETGAVTEVDDLTARARCFADAAGISDLLHAAPDAPVRLRIDVLAEAEGDVARRRARDLLAALLGDGKTPGSPVGAEQALVHWLVDPDDAAATAFWELLACARRSGALRQPLVEASASASVAETR